ncbi:hypothetical protein HZS_67 [Henneguya salminicola]|nr:hypothetical protein HZS_67 [Henneguya salminicola]
MSELASSIYSKMEKSLKVDLVIVIDDELLYTQIKEICQKRHIVVLPKSGGSKSISGDQRKKLRSKRVTEYFYGAQKELHPHTFSVSFDEIKIYKIGLPKVSEYCMPVGSEDSIQLEVILMEPNADMIHHLCAISCGENEKSILSSNIYGLVVM